MNSIDTEIQQLQARIAELEKIKKESVESDSFKLIENPSVSDNLDIINNILKDKKKTITNNRYLSAVPLARFYDQELVTRLEAIINILQQFNKRLIRLERKN
jgi:hypothetical protein